MKNISLTLTKALPEDLLNTLRMVKAVADETRIPFVLIGATARDVLLHHVYGVPIRRETTDVDFGVSLGTWEDFEKLKKSLVQRCGFRFDKKNPQSLRLGTYPNEQRIDVVPFGDIEKPAGIVKFPPGDSEMKTIGFEKVRANCVNIILEDDFSIPVASLAGIVLLKLISFSDRPLARERDVQDIFHIAKSYHECVGDRIFLKANEMGDEFDYDLASARLLGEDLGELLEDDSAAIVKIVLADSEIGGKLDTMVRIIARDRFTSDTAYSNIENVFLSFRRGALGQ